IANTGVDFGGVIVFNNSSTGGTARVEVFGGNSGVGKLDISSHTGGLSIGSIEGTGNVFLGANNLTVGSNSLSTTFSGVISDGGFGGGAGGSLTMNGTGTWTLSGANTYTDATTVSNSMLNIKSAKALGTAVAVIRV